MPLLELVFRLLLSGGNQSASAEELAQQLSQLRGAPMYPETVDQLLASEPRFYGVRKQVQEAAREQA